MSQRKKQDKDQREGMKQSEFEKKERKKSLEK